MKKSPKPIPGTLIKSAMFTYTASDKLENVKSLTLSGGSK